GWMSLRRRRRKRKRKRKKKTRKKTKKRKRLRCVSPKAGIGQVVKPVPSFLTLQSWVGKPARIPRKPL
ncbi:hypothetical protein DFQ28_004979, partial [Apophysomyces sp. BC1034]